MKHNVLLYSCLCFFLIPVCLIGQSGNQIIEDYISKNAFDDMRCQLSYSNISKNGRVQNRTLEQYVLKSNEGENKYKLLLQFIAPKDIKGTGLLTIQHPNKDDDQWLYLPVLKNAKRISASKKKDKFMGTEMSYEDLSQHLSEPQDENKYILISENESHDGHLCFVVEATTQDGEASQYSKRKLWIDQEKYVLRRADLYDNDGILLKRYSADHVQKVPNSNFYKAYQITLENMVTSNKTIVKYEDIRMNSGLNNALFSKNNLSSI